MDNIFLGSNWVIWFCIIVLLPFKIYDFFQEKAHKKRDYVLLTFTTAIILFTGIYTSFSEKFSFVDNLGFYILLLIAYLQTIIDCYRKRNTRDVIFSALFTIFIVLLFVVG